MFQYLSNKISSGENKMRKTVTRADGKEYLIEPEADLSDANLSGANLSQVTCNDIDFSSANLTSANLSGAELVKILTVNSN
ncbi:hypothetical protein CMK18_11175 [Candidatus Poribacteria bacterium]|nr:hypothetical protein [Candidatus Poribacteria bacterium]